MEGLGCSSGALYFSRISVKTALAPFLHPPGGLPESLYI